MRTKRNVQQLISVGMAMLMAHPALLAGPGPRRQAPAARPVSVGSRPVAPAAAAAAAAATPVAVRKPVAAQVVAALSGESATLLPDGRVLTLGGQSGAS